METFKILNEGIYVPSLSLVSCWVLLWEDTEGEEWGEGGGLEVRGAVRWRGRERVPFRTAKVLTMRKSLRVKADRTLTQEMKF